MSCEHLINYLSDDTKDINELLKTILQYSESKFYLLELIDGQVYTNKTSMDNTTHMKVTIIVRDNFSLKLFRKNSYRTEIKHDLLPFIRILSLLLNEETNNEAFIVNMSHEIRTPLNGVIGYSQLLKQTELNKTQEEYITSLSECSYQLMQIINDILDISKLNSGKMNLNDDCFSLEEIKDSVFNIIGGRIKDKKQKLNITISNTVPKYIVSDKQKLMQILMNLVSNSYKFTNEYGSISVVITNDTEQKLKVSVIDNGCGISKSNMNKLFRAFTQLNFSEEITGSGLGLVICKKLSILMGGDISVTSDENKGSTFTFTINYKNYEEIEREIETGSVNLHGKKILLIDENIESRMTVSDMLFDIGVQPVCCSTRIEGLSLIKNNRYKFSAVILDLTSNPEVSEKFSVEIKSQRPLLPLLGVTCKDFFIKSSAVDSRLEKPINKVQLFKKLCNILKDVEYDSSSSDSSENESNSPNSVFKNTKRILIAEDVSDNRKVLIEMLKNFGYKNIDIAENGQIAINKIDESTHNGNPYDILLLDIRMPVKDGYQVIEHITHKNLTKPKIVVITASVIQKERDKCMSMGVEYFITKPIDMQKLRKTMLRVSKV